MFNYFRLRILSFKYAFRGLNQLLLEPNFKIHILAMVIVVLLSVYLNLSNIEWAIIISCISFVIVAEAINTAIEKWIDFTTLEHKKEITKIKDISAAFVLISAINALIVGTIILLPKLLLKF